jgi:hypothetical protein
VGDLSLKSESDLDEASTKKTMNTLALSLRKAGTVSNFIKLAKKAQALGMGVQAVADLRDTPHDVMEDSVAHLAVALRYTIRHRVICMPHCYSMWHPVIHTVHDVMEDSVVHLAVALRCAIPMVICLKHLYGTRSPDGYTDRPGGGGCLGRVGQVRLGPLRHAQQLTKYNELLRMERDGGLPYAGKNFRSFH